MIKIIIASFCLFSVSAFAENVSFKLEGKNLKVAAQVSSLANKSILINGFDLSGTPYKLEITREPNKTGFIRVGYILERLGVKENSTVIIQKGKLAQIKSKQDDSQNPGLIFEATISE